MANRLLEALSMLDIPRRETWKALFGKEYGQEITGDPYSGFALEVLGDPLNLASLGLHKYLSRAAKALGPRYAVQGTGREALADMIDRSYPQVASEDSVTRVMNSPNLRSALSEVPPNADMLEVGGEAAVLDAGDGTVVRIQQGNPTRRLVDPMVLQPSRFAQYGDLSVERLPMVDLSENVRRPWGSPAMESYNAFTRDARSRARDMGIDAYDLHDGNIGLTPEGQWTVIDPGTFRGVPDELVRRPDNARQLPGVGYLTSLLGYTPEARRAAVGMPMRVPNRLIAAMLGYNAARSTR